MKPKPYVIDGPILRASTVARRLGISKRDAGRIHELALAAIEPKTMTGVQDLAEQWFGRNRFTVWISNAGRTRHIALRVKRGLMVEGVGPTWLDAFADAARLRRKIDR